MQYYILAQGQVLCYPIVENMEGGQAMAKTSAKAKNRWNGKAYDRINTMVPKGRKRDIEEYAQGQVQSVNGLVNDAVRQYIGMDEAHWKGKSDSNA